MHIHSVLATIVACSMSFVAAAPVAIKGREAAAKPQYGSESFWPPILKLKTDSVPAYGDYGDSSHVS
jgi:hypothetical protein